MGHRSRGSGRKPRAPKPYVFFTIFAPGRAVVEPSRHSLLRPATTRQNLHFPLIFHYSGPRTFIFLRTFIILEFLGHSLPGYPHQTLENLQAKPYCTLQPGLIKQLRHNHTQILNHSIARLFEAKAIEIKVESTQGLRQVAKWKTVGLRPPGAGPVLPLL